MCHICCMVQGSDIIFSVDAAYFLARCKSRFSMHKSTGKSITRNASHKSQNILKMSLERALPIHLYSTKFPEIKAFSVKCPEFRKFPDN